MRRASILLLCAAAAIGGCKLVDQRTFDRTADKPPVPRAPPAAAVPAGPTPLVTIRFPADPSDWQGVVRTAVGLARSRKPNVLFRVESLAAPGADPAATAAALSRAAGDARAVADTIVAAGADRGEVELTATTDPGLRGEEIRIFVR